MLLLNRGKTYTTEILTGGKRYYAEPVNEGCKGPRISVIPTVKPAPFSAFSFEVLSWQQVKVSPINAGSSAMQWDFGDGFKSFIPNVTHRFKNTGTYRIKLTLTSLLNGCVDSTINVLDILPSNINHTQLPIFNIYPNPASNELNVDGLLSIVNTYYLYDFSGKLIESNLITEDTKINVESLVSGVYFIQIKGYKTKLFVKE